MFQELSILYWELQPSASAWQSYQILELKPLCQHNLFVCYGNMLPRKDKTVYQYITSLFVSGNFYILIYLRQKNSSLWQRVQLSSNSLFIKTYFKTLVLLYILILDNYVMNLFKSWAVLYIWAQTSNSYKFLPISTFRDIVKMVKAVFSISVFVLCCYNMIPETG